MESVRIECERRTPSGKGGARKLRRAGFIPGVIYGMGRDPQPVTLRPKDIQNMIRRPHRFNSVVELVAGDVTQLAVVKEIERHPLTKEVRHVDFLRVDEDSPVSVTVPVVGVGRSKGEAMGGRRLQAQRRVLVSCKPFRTPVRIEVDLAPYEIGDRIFVDDLPYPDGVVPVFRQRYVVFSIAGARALDLPETAEGEEVEGEEAEGAEAEGGDAEGEGGEA